VVEEGAGRGTIHARTLGGTSAARALPGTLAAVDRTVAFAELLSRPEPDVDLERAALLIAAHARRDLDVDAELAAIDELAAGCDAADLASVLGHLFGRLGFRGNPDDYYDPCNSYLDRVVATRRGIPITLSVLTMAVARRKGIDLVGVAMPGHFLVRSATEPGLFVDPFGAGQVLDGAGARAMFHTLHGPDAAFSDTMLAPVGSRVIVTRMLNNLVAIFGARRDHHGRLWALQLRATIPGASLEDRAEVAAALAAVGEFADAGRWLDALSFEAPDRLRSRLN
jgi:regulator of sirC expression with transglutaminase-like and TPR domain